MNQSREQFVAERGERWRRLEFLLKSQKQNSRRGADWSELASLYRTLTADLMQAQNLSAGADVVRYINGLAAQAHNALYPPPRFSRGALGQFLLWDFPRTLRRNWRPLAIAAALFFGSHAVGTIGALLSEDFALNVLPPSTLEQMANAYADGFDAGRSENQDALMTGFYIRNNIGIAFRCFATGIFLGIGSAFFLIYNGLNIGTVLGYVSASGSANNILTFICGHGPFELFAIVIAGAGGLKMGYSLVDTRGLERLASLRHAAPELVQLILGATLMLAIAALLEGFWSPSSAPPLAKWVFSGVACLTLLLYCTRVGRAAPENASTLAHSHSPGQLNATPIATPGATQ